MSVSGAPAKGHRRWRHRRPLGRVPYFWLARPPAGHAQARQGWIAISSMGYYRHESSGEGQETHQERPKAYMGPPCSASGDYYQDPPEASRT
eukprot:6058218-Pyramimonas_sp.AAC.1